MNLGLAAQPDASYVATMQAINARIQNPLFFASFFGAVLFLLATLAVHFPRPRSGRFWLVALACALYALAAYRSTRDAVLGAVLATVVLVATVAAFDGEHYVVYSSDDEHLYAQRIAPSGIAEILTLAEELLSDPSFRHGPVAIAFTPDEEIGRGADRFDVAGFGADYAFTMDGGAFGELEYENFNAAALRVWVKGINIHPGSAKGKMKNAMRIAMEYEMMLPAGKKPEYTAGYDGFIHLDEMKGDVGSAMLRYILRDHDLGKLEAQKAVCRAAADFLNAKYGEGTVRLELRDGYRNMAKQIEPHRHLVDNAVEAIRLAGAEPCVRAIRGGTDGATLSYMGLPCPNLGTGGGNFHGVLEYCCIQEMDQAVACMKNILALYAKA